MNDRFRLLLAPALGLALMAGCGAPPPASEGPIAADPTTAIAADPADKVAVGAPATPVIDVTEITLSAEEMDQIKKLPEAEQAMALGQKVCPSSGENLGSMGAPLKMDVKGQTVFLCCKGCTEDAEKNPDTMLAKLGKKASEPAAAPEATATP